MNMCVFILLSTCKRNGGKDGQKKKKNEYIHTYDKQTINQKKKEKKRKIPFFDNAFMNNTELEERGR